VNNFGEKVSFIWNVADLLRGPYRPAQYKDVMQGQRSLSRYSSEGFDEEVVVPSAGTAFHDQAVFARMLFQ